jgi:hypothetical protein
MTKTFGECMKKRGTQNEIVEHKKTRRQLQKALRNPKKQRNATSIANRIHTKKAVEEEVAERIGMTLEQAKFIRTQLPILLNRFSKIRDPRNPKKLKHKLTVLLVFGIMCFIYNTASRREANAVMTQPMFVKTLTTLYPELESIPHQDTLNRVLSSIEPKDIEKALCDLIRNFIRKKKFRRLLVNGRYSIAFDGSQKFKSSNLLNEKFLQRKNGKDGELQFFVYVLEANFVFPNGLSVPFMSEFLDYSIDSKNQAQTEAQIKQDCELKAFKRLSERVKKEFPHLPITALLDGLYANGPAIEICHKNKWQYMITLKDGNMKTVWNEAEGLKKIQTENVQQQNWNGRRQDVYWVNGIEYVYGDQKQETLNVVVCEETWESIDDENNTEVKKSKHAWISSKKITPANVHTLCNLIARNRWGIETSFLEEKHFGYNYEHIYSTNWKAMMGYHFLMRIAHALNTIARFTKLLKKMIAKVGIKKFISYIRETCATLWQLIEKHKSELKKKHYFSLT